MRALLLLSTLLLATPALAQNADARLRALYDAQWQWTLKEYGRRADETGPGAYEGYLPKVDPASWAARQAHLQSVMKQLDAIPAAELSPEEAVNAAVFRAWLEEDLTDLKFKAYEAPVNSDSFFWSYLAPQDGFQNADEYRRYIARLRDIPRYFDENVANMRAGLKRGFSVPRVTLTGRDDTIEPYLKNDAANPLRAPLDKMPASIPTATQQQLRAEGEAAIQAAIPAFAKLLAFLREEYLPKTRTSLAAAELPDGKAYYQAMIRKFATLDLTPRQIHDIGLAEVARITAEMEATKTRAGFKGSLAAFITFLRTDPQFYAKTPDELMGVSAYVIKRTDGRMGEFFGTLPRFRHGLKPVPDTIAPIYTAGRGGLEACWMNTYDLPSRPLYAIPALTLHECTPGHSFQAALALEGKDQPDFRKELYFSGYGEGWGLYTEWLGTLMGIYRTPYEDFGRLTYEMWRAARLVIDTGIHEYGWSRDKALAYLRDHTALSEREITTEIDRYISWPGQAVAYKLGEMEIRRLRGEAEAKLGEKFDQRAFHDTVLATGGVPLSLLRQRVEAWIAAGGPATYAKP